MTDAMCTLTGEAPTNMRDFVKLHAAEFKQRGGAFLRRTSGSDPSFCWSLNICYPLGKSDWS
jgi:hypothetical protein